jgi:hypothetical protein
MKRLVIGAVVLAAVVAPLMSTNASAGGAKLKKPGKIDPTTMVVSGGLPFPLGLTCGPLDAECTADGGYGHMTIAFPVPVDGATGHVDFFTATCTPKYALAPKSTDFPTAPITKTFGPIPANYASNATLGAQGYTKTGNTITLMMPKYVDPANTGADQYPSLSCAITSSNSPVGKFLPGTLTPAYPGGGGGTVASKPPKLTSSPASDCRLIGDAANNDSLPLFDPSFMRPPNDPTYPNASILPGTHLHLSVLIQAAGLEFQFCSTDASYRAKFLTDQETIISAGKKVTYKAAKVKNGVETAPAVRLAFVKKLGLTSPVNSSIPLTVSGSKIIYQFDPAKLQVVGGNAGCVYKAAKTAGKTNVCVINNGAGTITLNSTDVTLIKVGKPIQSATADIAFSYVNNALHPETTSGISMTKAETSITIGAVTVAVVLQPFGIQTAVADANIGFPAVLLEGLL